MLRCSLSRRLSLHMRRLSVSRNYSRFSNTESLAQYPFVVKFLAPQDCPRISTGTHPTAIVDFASVGAA
jgi:hypothetical protein